MLLGITSSRTRSVLLWRPLVFSQVLTPRKNEKSTANSHPPEVRPLRKSRYSDEQSPRPCGRTSYARGSPSSPASSVFPKDVLRLERRFGELGTLAPREARDADGMILKRARGLRRTGSIVRLTPRAAIIARRFAKRT